MKKTLAIMLALIMVLALVPTVAFAEEPKKIYVDANNGNDDTGDGTETKPYKTVEAAAKAAAKDDTIMLGEGKYTLYGVSSDDTTKGKNLTFVGQGVEKTTWIIGAEVPDPNKSGTEYNSDYSFSGASVTFKDMTLNSYYSKEDKNKSGYENYLGFAHTVNTLVDSCVINGVTAYWGYTSAAFRNTTFNAPVGGYALWSYSSAIMTFDNCTFNSSGKVINVYNEGYTPNVTVNFNNCTVNSKNLESLSVMNINDTYVDFTINFTGNNSINGIKADGIQVTGGSHASAASNTNPPSNKTSAQATCSKLFEFNMKYGNGNNKRTTVKIDDKTVWTGGEMVSHAIDTTNDKYTDGYKDNAFDIITTPAGGYVKKCRYCGYTEPFYGELSNEIELTRTVMQGQEVNANPKDTYKVNGSSNITVDYTATMNMENLKWLVAGKDVKDIPGALGTASSPWELLKYLALAEQIDDRTEVILTFKFDDKIDLKAFEKKYKDGQKVLELTSDMFEMTDVAFGPEKDAMTIKCNWNWNKEKEAGLNPTIILKGNGLPVEANWGESKQINIENSGCVGGAVHIKYEKPESDAKAISVDPAAANVQVQNTGRSEIFPTIRIPIVGGRADDKFTLYYGGGSSGDSSGGTTGGGYYHPTTTPVPVIVIPPKTGDMTVWQSILHFLGIR